MKKTAVISIIFILLTCSISCASIPSYKEKPLHGSPYKYTLIEGALCADTIDLMYEIIYLYVSGYSEDVIQNFFIENYPMVFMITRDLDVYVIQETMEGLIKVKYTLGEEEMVIWTLKDYLRK